MIDNRSNPEVVRQSAVNVMRRLGMEPDPWQIDALADGHKQLELLHLPGKPAGVESTT